MLEFIDKKKDCTGCGACLNVCPVDAITMHKDEEGFFYPYADENCIDCGECRQACPLASEKSPAFPDFEQRAFAAVTKSKETWKASSSGGAFTEICKTFGDDDTVIFGAAFDGLKVRHSYVTGRQHIGVFRKSKYVQSDIGTCYRDVSRHLKKNKYVIFSGTPCQIAGLRSYLRRNYDRLLCIDFICHGVGSPGVFNSFLDYLEAKYNSRIVSYTFRVKKVLLGNFALYTSRYVFENQKPVYAEVDEYNRLFLNQLCLRPSCAENCQFRSSNRSSDLTMADFKRRDKIFPKVSDYKNYSTLIVNSKKGNKVLKGIESNMAIRPCPMEHVKRFNPLFDSTRPGNPLRDEFFKDFADGMTFQELVKTYTTPAIKPNALRWLKRMIPYKFKRWINRIRETS